MTEKNKENWQDYILNIPDYPKKDINFKDITPLVGNAKGFKTVIDLMANICERKDISPEQLACPEARGFMFGSALAYRLGNGFLPLRKPGKLPRKTYELEYKLEYGSTALQIHIDDITKGQRIVLIDDVLATGGTISTCIEILQKYGAVVPACIFVIELDELGGRKEITNKYPHIQIHSLAHY